MGRINSKQKGKRGELEFAHECEKYGFTDVYRTAQCNGKLEQSLADCEGLPEINIEVKRVESLNIDTAMEQSIRDTKTKKEKRLPTVFHRKNHKPWKATMLFEHWIIIYKGYLKYLEMIGEEDKEE